jgi:hypothetical protein
MSEKSFIDKAASIATILALPVGIVGCYFAWLALTPKKDEANPKQEQSVSIEQQLMVAEPPTVESSQANAEPAIFVTTTDGTRFVCQGIGGNLDAAFSAAKGIRLRTHKDDVLVPLSRQALCANNFDLYEAIVDELSYRTRRDDVLVEGVDFVLKLRRFELAEKYAQLIYFRSTADKVREKIATTAVKKS